MQYGIPGSFAQISLTSHFPSQTRVHTQEGQIHQNAAKRIISRTKKKSTHASDKIKEARYVQ